MARKKKPLEEPVEQNTEDMYTIYWSIVLAKGPNKLGEYSNNVSFDTMKLLQKVTEAASNQMFDAVLKDDTIL